MQPARATFADYAELAFSVVAAVQIGYYFRYLHRYDPWLFGFLVIFLVGPAAIAGVLLLISYRKEIREDPAAPAAALLTVAATLYLAALPFAYGGYGLLAAHLVTEWKLYVLCVAAIVTIDQKFFRINTRIYECIYRVLHSLLPAKIPEVRHDIPPPPSDMAAYPPPKPAPARLPAQAPRGPGAAPPPARKPQPPAKTSGQSGQGKDIKKSP